MFAERMERLRVRLTEDEPLMPKSSKVTDTNILSVADVELDSSFLEKSQLVFGDKFDFATRNGAYRRWSCQCEKNFPGTGGRQFYRHRKRL